MTVSPVRPRRAAAWAIAGALALVSAGGRAEEGEARMALAALAGVTAQAAARHAPVVLPAARVGGLKRGEVMTITGRGLERAVPAQALLRHEQLLARLNPVGLCVP